MTSLVRLTALSLWTAAVCVTASAGADDGAPTGYGDDSGASDWVLDVPHDGYPTSVDEPVLQGATTADSNNYVVIEVEDGVPTDVDGETVIVVQEPQPVAATDEAPPPPRTVVVEQPVDRCPGGIWVDGYWAYANGQYVWNEGHCVVQRVNYVFVHPRWDFYGSVWWFVPGYYRPCRVWVGYGYHRPWHWFPPHYHPYYRSARAVPVARGVPRRPTARGVVPASRYPVSRAPTRTTTVGRAPTRTTTVGRTPNRTTTVGRAPTRTVSVGRAPSRAPTVTRAPTVNRTPTVTRTPQVSRGPTVNRASAVPRVSPTRGPTVTRTPGYGRTPTVTSSVPRAAPSTPVVSRPRVAPTRPTSSRSATPTRSVVRPSSSVSRTGTARGSSGSSRFGGFMGRSGSGSVYRSRPARSPSYGGSRMMSPSRGPARPSMGPRPSFRPSGSFRPSSGGFGGVRSVPTARGR